ncbi:MAG: N-acetylneuraminate synthase [Bacteroidota bacterium]
MRANKVLIIAEAGVNHNGDIDTAKALIRVAADAGADFVKFQTFKSEKLVSSAAPQAAYQSQSSPADSQLEMIKKYELDEATHLELIKTCKEHGIQFLSTAFDLESIDLLDKIGIPIFKIPSGELTNLPYLEKIGALNKNVILSTGMANLSEIEQAIDILLQAGMKRYEIAVLHCNTEYPTPFEDVNLKAMQTIADAFKVAVGYSDHTLGIEVPIAAVALGASCIEKHFTLDRNMPGPDHKASLEPAELKAMIKAIRNIEIALGSGIKKPSTSETKNIAVARKSIHLNKHVPAGHILTKADLIMKRPGDGISPMLLNMVLGKALKNDGTIDQKLRFNDLI